MNLVSSGSELNFLKTGVGGKYFTGESEEGESSELCVDVDMVCVGLKREMEREQLLLTQRATFINSEREKERKESSLLLYEVQQHF